MAQSVARELLILEVVSSILTQSAFTWLQFSKIYNQVILPDFDIWGLGFLHGLQTKWD